MKLILLISVICFTGAIFSICIKVAVVSLTVLPFEETLGQDCETTETNMFITFNKEGQKYYVQASQVLAFRLFHLLKTIF